jgi:hypothetical protein
VVQGVQEGPYGGSQEIKAIAIATLKHYDKSIGALAEIKESSPKFYRAIAFFTVMPSKKKSLFAFYIRFAEEFR